MGFKQILKEVLDFTFPPKCILCGNIDTESNYPYLCNECFTNIKLIDEPFCKICGTPFSSKHSENHICTRCLGKKPAFDLSRSIGIYEGKLEELIKAFKYGKNRFLYKPISDLLTKNLNNRFPDVLFDFVVPVPLGKRKLRERGFNQSYLLAKNVCKNLFSIFDYKNLVKIKETKPQVELQFKERQENVQGSFVVKNGEVFKDKTILLIDDVATTGSTLDECARVLKNECKARHIYCLTVARTVINN